ncbi:MAG: hypothetical protein ACRC3J_05770 [Culicoidibacterales bacterium]
MNDFKITATLYTPTQEEVDLYETTPYHIFKIVIDGKESYQHVDVRELASDLVVKGKHIPWYANPHEYQTLRTCFYPWSCSCGNAGCAGIWESVLCKHRKYNVEWRVPKDMGYHIEGFFSFDKNQYISEIIKAFELEDFTEDFECDSILEYIKKYKERK